MNKLISFLLLLMLLLPSYALSAVENLDEVVSRKTRQRVNAFYSGESTEPYVWQPQTLNYTDVTTGHEVWRMSSTPATKNVYHNDIHWSSWSADGKYLSYNSKFNDSLGYITGAFTGTDGYDIWFTPRTDGTYLKVLVNTPSRAAELQDFFSWSPSVVDTYYGFGRTRAGNTGVNPYDLYSATVSDTSTAKSLILSFPSTTTLQMNKSVTPDGKKIVATEWDENNLFPATVYPTPALDDVDGYSIDLGLDTYWGNTPATVTEWHDQHIAGSTGNYWFYFLPSGTTAWWRMRLTGSGADGEPIHIEDHISPYDWGNELEPANVGIGNNPFAGTAYWSHGTPDNWGRFVVFSSVEISPISPAVENTDDHTIDQDTYGIGGTQHHDYSAWSDYFVSTRGPDGVDYSGDYLAIMKHNAGASSVNVLAYTHDLYNNGGTYAGADFEYSSIPRPFQSPDGTKIGFHSTFLNTKIGTYDDKPDVFWAVAYYPYSPEITATSATGGTVTIRFDWQNTLADPNPRTYTTRGWPSETTDDRPIPRETSKYRLWRSADKITWSPVKTINAEHFTRFDFADGGFKVGQDSFWEITDTPGDGTFYYAVTSIEHSGLESRTLSNIFAVTIASGTGTGSQDTAYPADPGADSNITTAYNSECHKYYNIYAEDGATPTIDQTNRIASDPRTTKSFVDWLGKTDGTTQYLVTAVDTQGNESEALSTTIAYQQAPATAVGQYTVTWTEGRNPTTIDPTGAITTISATGTPWTIGN